MTERFADFTTFADTRRFVVFDLFPALESVQYFVFFVANVFRKQAQN